MCTPLFQVNWPTEHAGWMSYTHKWEHLWGQPSGWWKTCVPGGSVYFVPAQLEWILKPGAEAPGWFILGPAIVILFLRVACSHACLGPSDLLLQPVLYISQYHLIWKSPPQRSAWAPTTNVPLWRGCDLLSCSVEGTLDFSASLPQFFPASLVSLLPCLAANVLWGGWPGCHQATWLVAWWDQMRHFSCASGFPLPAENWELRNL